MEQLIIVFIILCIFMLIMLIHDTSYRKQLDDTDKYCNEAMASLRKLKGQICDVSYAKPLAEDEIIEDTTDIMFVEGD